MRNYGNRMRLRQSGDLARLCDAAHTIGVELDVVQRTSFEQLAKSVERELMFAAGDRNLSAGLQLRITMDVVWNDRLLKPSEMKRLEQWQHSLGVVESPAHVGVGHDIDVVADSFTDRTHELKIFLHATSAVSRSPSKAELHRLVAFFFVAPCFRRNLSEFHAVKSGGVNGYAGFRPAAEQAIDGLFGGFSQQVPQRDIQ